MGLSSFPELPPELWINILKHASRDVQRNCLLVSLTLHDLAVPFVFSRVVVQNCEIWDGLSPWSDEDLRQYRAMKERSWNTVQEFLRHIIATPMIAHAIRSFWMQWNNDEMLESKDAQSESTFQAQEELVQECIMAMPNLHEFQLAHHDFAPRLSDGFVRALLTRSNLKVFSLPILRIVESEEVSRLKGLTSLLLPLRFCEGNYFLNGDNADLYIARIGGVVASNAATLRRLLVVGYAPWDCPLQELEDLSFIGVLDINEKVYHTLAQHSTNLTSLAITGYDELLPILSALEAAPDAFPLLSSFKFLYYVDTAGDDCLRITQATALFIKHKTFLRRLYVSYAPVETDREALYYQKPILEALPGLPRLKVLGLDIEGIGFDESDLLYLEQHLPANLTDLLFCIYFQGPIAVDSHSFASLFTNQLSLRTIDLYNSDYEESYRVIRKAARFVHRKPPPHLEHVVFNGRVRPVCHCHRPHATTRNAPALSLYDPADTVRSLDEYDLDDWVWLRKFNLDEDYHELEFLKSKCRSCGARRLSLRKLADVVDLRCMDGFEAHPPPPPPKRD
ncbi:hypothetical protein C8Q76DRAFT_861818 [Earliella scabrosa]|nr:hypothetical protein C8Q76DRAFT_861818 [Earliella scabrosa]